jgi:O-methyltransferase involved in polyketide biosynthesis
MEQVFVIMRMKEFDRCSQQFMEQHPKAVVVHLACGLDTRFERIDNGLVEWFDLDLPEVITVRAGLIDEKQRSHRLAYSALDFTWMDAVKPLRERSFLFLAEGFFSYLSQAEVKQLVLGLKENFPGSELVFDSTPPILKYMSRLHPELKNTRACVRWGLGNSHILESWGSGICLLSEWYYFTQTELRLKPYRWMRFLPVLGKGYKIVHYRLGK